MPAIVTNRPLLNATLQSAASLQTRHEGTLYVIVNALTICAPEDFRRMLAQRFAGRVELVHELGAQRSVAASWNKGCELAEQDGAEYLAIVGNDTRAKAGCLDTLLDYAERGKADLCSGWGSQRRRPTEGEEWMDGVAFSCAVCRLSTWRKHGLFDTNFRPAYFEDDDYYARVVLGGGQCHVLAAAKFFHHGSLTIRNDKEVANRVRMRINLNRAYFARKWGVGRPRDRREGVLRDYFRTPFNDASKPLSWFPSDEDARASVRIPDQIPKDRNLAGGLDTVK